MFLRCFLSATITVAASLIITASAGAQLLPSYEADPFRQLEEVLPSPNDYRAASGAPGHEYWQQAADYRIKIKLDDDKQRLTGSETVLYTNNSPLALEYIWLQLDQNRFERESDNGLTRSVPDGLAKGKMPFKELDRLLHRDDFDGGHRITRVVGKDGKPLDHTIVKTMMRIDLPNPLQPGQKFEFSIDWDYSIVDGKKIFSRSGYEFFKEDGNYIYEIAQWFPRLVAYTDVNGWQHKQFLGRGEFTLEFGDYHVEITVPQDHVVASTGELKNADQVLSAEQVKRLKDAGKSKIPMFIVTPEEAEAAEKKKVKGFKTWVFEAKNVRDFAWASSRKFIWDAVLHPQKDGKPVWCMSYYPNEAEPLWSKYSTHSVMHTIDVYGRHTFPYPYPVAISVNGSAGGMEYPMICYNGPRPEKDGTYSQRTKYGLISVVIHEVGHNWFPMIVNSDERQWTWMDEGLNTFLQFLAEEEWEQKYPNRRGHARAIVPYMTSSSQVPIMTNSESLRQFGSNAYAKPATALNILRETILGRELFDFAFKTYSRRWMFKRPQPSDFFRSMEDASGIDLDWFWHGWFYTTKHVDLGIRDLALYEINGGDPDVEKPLQKEKRDREKRDSTEERNESLPKRLDRFPELSDFYNKFDDLNVTDKDREDYEKFRKELDGKEKALLKLKAFFYVVRFNNSGGLVMPVILNVHHEDGSTREIRYPAEVWAKGTLEVSKLIISKKKIASLELDPLKETADANLRNNHWPPKVVESRFELFKEKKTPNPMQKARDWEKKKEEEKAKGKEKESGKESGKGKEDEGGKKKADSGKKKPKQTVKKQAG